MEYFYRSQNYIIVASVISILIFSFNKQRFNYKALFIILLFSVVELFQFVLFGGFNIRTPLGTVSRLLLAYIVLELTKWNFLKVYVNVIYFFALVSFVFYFTSFIPGVFDFYKETLSRLIPQVFPDSDEFYKESPNIIIYNFHQISYEMSRNPGPFWEPGAFAVFIMLAILFNNIVDRKVFSKTNLFFIAALITTFSTTGYICLFVFLIYSNYSYIKKNILYFVLFLAIVSGTIIMYERIPFLKEKIKKDIEISNETTSSRFGSALADYNDFIKSPIFGYGRAGARYNFKDVKFFDVENHRNNGFFNLLVTYGIIITSFYMFKIYQSFKLIGKKFGLATHYQIFSFVIILLLGFSQGIYMRPLFYGFMFMPLIFMTNSKTLLENSHRYSDL